MKHSILRQRSMAIAVAMALSTAVVADPVLTPPAGDYPLKDFENAGSQETNTYWRTPYSSLSWADIHNVGLYGSTDLTVDLTGIEKVSQTVGTGGGLIIESDPFSDLIWRTCSGPYPFEFGETDYDYSTYRRCNTGNSNIEVDRYFGNYNTNEWPEGQCSNPDKCPSMTMAYRILSDHGFYDGRASFTADIDGDGNVNSITPITTITEGPFMNMLTSDDTSRALITFETSDDCNSRAFVSRLNDFYGEDTTYTVAKDGVDQEYYRHEIEITGLTPSRLYRYQVYCEGGAGNVKSGEYLFKSAPYKGSNTRTSFAFIADTRMGVDSMEMDSMGVNLTTANRMAADAFRRRADVFVIGGDLIQGYSTKNWAFRAQLKAWKRAMGGFWRTRPVVAAIGNHEVLMDNYDYTQADSDNGLNWSLGLDMDKRPYDTDSAEAVFADEFWHPENGPEPADPERPTYKENVYSFQYGKILFIAANNNYWYTANDFVGGEPSGNFGRGSIKVGGSPEGYMMDDQLDWIEDELDRAEDDPTIKYIFLYFQEPVFPNSTHVTDVLWWYGNNNVMAYEASDDPMDGGNGNGIRGDDGDVVVPVTDEAGNTAGILEVRDRLWTALADSSKMAAVLAGDEHVYHRQLIDRNTPVGNLALDDDNGDGIINWHGTGIDGTQIADGVIEDASGNPNFRCPLWHLTISAGGAPWYGEVDTPWKEDMKKFSSQYSYGLFRTTGRGISFTLYTLNGQVIDRVSNLMDIKRGCGV